MPEDAQRHLVGIVFLITAAVCLLLAIYQAYSERVAGGSWRPWPFTLGWRLVAMFLALTLAFGWPGWETWADREALDIGRAWTTGLVTVTALLVFIKFARGDDA